MTQGIITVILFIVFILCGAGLVAIIIYLLRQNAKNRIENRMDNFVGVVSETDQHVSSGLPTEAYARGERLEGFRGKINRWLSFFSTYSLQQKISSAYWPITDVEYISIEIGLVIVGFIIGSIIPHSIIGGIGLAFLFYLIPGLVLNQAIITRRKKFQNQLLDFLVLVKGAVLAGYSLQQALDLAIKEVTPPASEEFGRVIREVRFGFPLDQALINLADRMQSDDLQIVVTAIVINSQVGGNLSTVLEATIDTIRERIHLFGEIRSLTSYARYVGTLLSLLPFAAGLLIFMMSPGYFDNVGKSVITRFIFILALIGILIGNFLIRRIVRIRV